jgi:hypothetical protein
MFLWLFRAPQRVATLPEGPSYHALRVATLALWAELLRAPRGNPSELLRAQPFRKGLSCCVLSAVTLPKRTELLPNATTGAYEHILY